MKNISNPIVFFGTELFSLTSLQALLDANYFIAAVVTKPDSRKGRGQKLIAPDVKLLAQQHSIPVLQPTSLKDIAETIAALGEPTGVLVSYGKIIPQSIIDLFTPGIINVHPSLLPTYRGPSPIETAIKNGDTCTGVSIMQLSAAMDAGPVYAQKTQFLNGNETAKQQYTTLGIMGAELLLSVLPAIIDTSLRPVAQDDTAASYCTLLTKQDGEINWNQPTSAIEQSIRALGLWPQSRTTLRSIEVIILSGHAVVGDSLPPHTPGSFIVDPNLKSLAIKTADGYYAVDTIKPLGKKEMPIQAFLSGYASKLIA